MTTFCQNLLCQRICRIMTYCHIIGIWELYVLSTVVSWVIYLMSHLLISIQPHPVHRLSWVAHHFALEKGHVETWRVVVHELEEEHLKRQTVLIVCPCPWELWVAQERNIVSKSRCIKVLLLISSYITLGGTVGNPMMPGKITFWNKKCNNWNNCKLQKELHLCV